MWPTQRGCRERIRGQKRSKRDGLHEGSGADLKFVAHGRAASDRGEVTRLPACGRSSNGVALRKAGIWMVGRELLRDVVVDESLFK